MSTDIATLFARDPLRHTDEDITRIIEKFRENRSTFISTGKAPPKVSGPVKLTAKETEVKKLGLNLDIDLGSLKL